ncbi:DUF881 domain-containing protein [Clostridium luticellarii]|jgi:uncharacterized protein YlxW (UPF0749 family)|uniref:Division initiation protein n=1 Tax=Clostridium luticellarii TaxID=1691940 RepID=A0A2T0BRT9_9CLOT|nr:DUF881 domain-containing protein [Clostridium luticellarii]MCI1943715.1 DUF881 domain-containing protein [Clostridium luticellarii]MCI1966976.1 DUF881 domain-containing protein [Clostridium luticellarii]MCI1994343.1 DUF881 domain-containing protein [Clostridium luticellarii]MCI2038704.1 DUF881 domain-containing protein [Clostridium luticellarii]PRR86579.1 hypothetical protein CLLU_03800 [Clostridium luticellarii]
MKSNEANIFVFIASVIIGVLISMNISLVDDGTNKRVFLSAKQYQDAYNYKNQLHNQILALSQQYSDNYNKLKKYEDNEENEAQVVAEIKQELNQNNMELGKMPVQGQGIKIFLNDAAMEDGLNAFQYQMRLVHNTDVIQVMNDLKNAGAEAISINGHRMVDTSEIYCSGPFLRVNGIKIASPFSIYAIGNKDVLYNYMMSNENYLKVMMTRKIVAVVTKSDSIKVPAYSGDYKVEFMKNKD